MSTPLISRRRSVHVGIVGAGAIAERHAVALRAAGARLVAVADPDPRRAAVLAGVDGVPTHYPEATDMFAHPGLDAVVIASPNRFHAAQSVAALRAGLHVLTEIPVATSLVNARAVADAAQQSGRVAAVAHTLRFCEPYRTVREWVESGVFQVRHVVARTLMLRQGATGMGGRPRTWFDDLRWHHGAHTVDAALWLLDADDAHVAGHLGPPGRASGRPMDLAMTLTTSDGALATIALSYHAHIPARDMLLIAEDAAVRIDGARLVASDGTVVDCGSPDEMERAAIVRQDEDFIAAVVGEHAPACSVHDVLPTMRALDRLDTLGGGTA